MDSVDRKTEPRAIEKSKMSPSHSHLDVLLDEK